MITVVTGVSSIQIIFFPSRFFLITNFLYYFCYLRFKFKKHTSRIIIIIDQAFHTLGITAIITICIGFYFGIHTFIKWLKNRKKIHILFFSMSIIFGMVGWLPEALSYLLYVFTKTTMPYKTTFFIIIIAGIIGFVSWINLYFLVRIPEDSKLRRSLIFISSVFSILHLGINFYNLFFAPNAPVHAQLGENKGIVVNSVSGILAILMIVILIIVSTTGIELGRYIIKTSIEPINKNKGKLIVIGFILLPFGTLGDSLVYNISILIIVFRIILITAWSFLYLGFIMPLWLQKKLEKKIH